MSFISQNSIAFEAYYAKVVKDRPILSAEYRFYFWPKLIHPVANF